LPQHYVAYTLVDISNTNMFNSRTSDTKSYNQQQNLNTLVQVLGLRSQPINMSVTMFKGQDLVNFKFGKQFSGLHNVWKFDFLSEHTDVYSKNNNPTYLLEEDNDGVAFIKNLDETVTFKNPVFKTKDKNLINLYFLKV